MHTHAAKTPGIEVRASVRPIGSHPGGTVREGRVPGWLRRLSTGVAATAMLHGALLGVFPRGEPYPALARSGTTQMLSSLDALVPWTLTALVLLWLAGRQPALYARGALALLLTAAAGLAYSCWTDPGGLPAREGSLFRDYAALPGALTGWYLLTALAMAAAAPSIRVRILVATAGSGAVVISVLPSADPVTAAIFAAAVPLLAWFLTGRLPGRRARRRRRADAWYPGGEAMPPRDRAKAGACAPTRRAG
ncbi:MULTISPECIES: hypothetical protein [Streptomyces]|uniref:Uncharacterized protein n=1 Tax=Streptomyces parvulus TaxID=146923 RepID=A0A191VAW6_9ACTN|nr:MULTISPECIES: hypothetical protein [Streptomyces]ANJ12055.1 hypothetical protein Spa2297_33795 [Streptomyces parvulus]MZD56047.1 hypothetical protein [Streptomyces sp. SID5606]GGS05364.1 hypothetical protein GCM10010220_67020 [Streptomyces parvulus]